MGNPFDQFDATPTAADALNRPVIIKPAAPDKPDFVPGAPGYIVKNGAAEKLPGLPADAGDQDPGLDPKTADFYAHQVLSGGQLPALGMGKAAAQIRRQVMERVAAIGDEMGLGGADLATQQAHYKAAQKQVSTLENQLGTTQQNEQTALLNGQQFMDRSTELPGQTQLPIINSIIQTAQRHLPVPGHDTIAAMDAAWNTFVNEYAKVVSGTPSGGGTLSDSARHEAMQTMQGNYSLSQKQAAFAQMKADMANRLTAMNGTIDQAYQNITLQPGHHADATVPGIGAPPPGGDGPANPFTSGSGPDGPTLTPSGGETRAVIDPGKQALGAQIAGLMSRGADRNTILGFAVGNDPSLRSDPKFRAWVDQALAYRAKNPKAKFAVDPSFYTAEVPLNLDEQNRNQGAQSALGAAMMSAGDAALLGNADNLMGDKATNALAVANAQNPTASILGTMAGGAAVAGAGEAGLGATGMVSGPLRTGLADFLYGAGASGTHGGNPLIGGGEAALGGYLGGKATSGVGKAVKGVTNPTVSYVAKEVPLTLGQSVSQSGIVGRSIKGVEDRLSGIPVLGDTINERRLDGFQKMNSAAFDRALEPIGAKVDGAFGEEAVQHAQDAIHNAFDAALKGKSASVDTPFITQAASAKRAIQGLPPSVAVDVENHVDAAIKDYFDPKTLTISGENMQGLLRDLQQIKQSYQSDPAGHRIGKVVDQVTSSVEGMFQRQAPDVMPAYDAAKQAYKRVSTLQNAVLAAKQVSDGKNAIFTPAQLGIADRATTIKYGGRAAAAAGKGEFHEFQRKMQSVLPNKVPDSGTVGRLLIPGALVAAGTGGGALTGETGEGLTLGALLAAAYSKTGQRALAASVLKRPSAARAAGTAISRAAPMVGHGAAAVAATKRD